MHVGFLRPVILSLILVMSIIIVLPPHVAAQESVGFVAPADVSPLLDYRLPDWSYRVWDVAFGFNGGGSDYESSNVGYSAGTHSFSGSLASDFRQNWESEARTASLWSSLSGNYLYGSNADGQGERRVSKLDSHFLVQGQLDQYLTGSRFFVTGDTRFTRYYQENHDDYEANGVVDEQDEYQRRDELDGSVGAGWGRLRNVVPLLRAERVSARLVALGRSALTDDQLQQLARVFAQQYGYRAVFDRSDRRFWQDVLAPLLDPDRPLSPAEIFYLKDVLNEVLGDRFEGVRFVGTGRYNSRLTNDDLGVNSRYRQLSAGANWSHNPSLTRQIAATASVNYAWRTSGGEAAEYTGFHLGADHLWNLADRYRWDLSVGYDQQARVDSDMRTGIASTGTSFHVYLEDRVELVTSAAVTRRWSRDAADETTTRWNWNYQLGLTYHLDRAIF